MAVLAFQGSSRRSRLRAMIAGPIKCTTVAVAGVVVKFERVTETFHILGRYCAAHPEANESCGATQLCKDEYSARRETDGSWGGRGVSEDYWDVSVLQQRTSAVRRSFAAYVLHEALLS